MGDMDLDYLKHLGYSQNEIQSYANSWNTNIILYLAENSDSVSENMNFIKKEFDKDLLLKLPIFYPDSFVLPPMYFRERMQLFKDSFPDDWVEIIEQQFWGYEGRPGTNYRPIMMEMASSDGLNKAIKQLENPEDITFEFMIMLSEGVGIELYADDFNDLELLLEMEVFKHEIIRNSKHLIGLGLSRDIVEGIIRNEPYLMMLSELEVVGRLRDKFGEDFINEMSKMDEDSIYLILEKIL